MYTITYELTSESNTLFILGIIIYINLNYLNFQNIDNSNIEHDQNDEDYLKKLFKYFNFSISNVKSIYKSLWNKTIINPELSIVNKYIINVKLNKKVGGFQERKKNQKQII